MKYRSIARVLVFTIITLGIYALFWLKTTRDEMTAKGIKVPRFIILILPLLAFIASLAAIAVQDAMREARGVHDNPITPWNWVAVLAVFSTPFVILYWLYWYCKGVEKVTNKQISFGLSFGSIILFCVFGFDFLWPAIIQDGFNKVSSGPPSPDSSPPLTPTSSPHEPPAPTPATPRLPGPPASSPPSSNGPILYRR